MAEEETSFDSTTTANTIDGTNDGFDLQLIDDLEDIEDHKHLISLREQEVLIEQLKHEKLILEEWKQEIGLVAVETVDTLTTQIEITQNTSQRYQYEIESLETKNKSLTQQIEAYQDEIDKLHKEKPKMEQEINHFSELLNDQYMMNQSLSSKESELIALKHEYESNKISLQNADLELKTLRRENDEIKKENEEYQLLLDKYREQEIKFKKELNDQQLEIQSLNNKYNELQQELQVETVETRKQLQVARHIANNLSDQLEEIHNLSPQNLNGNNNNGDGHNHNDELPIFGRPLFEKRKTLKILTIEKSLKLPNMSDIIIDEQQQIQSDDEFIDFAASKSPQPPIMKKIKTNKLAPVNEFNGDDEEEEGDINNDINDDEKQMRLPLFVGTKSFEIDDEKEKLIKERQRSSSSGNSSISNSFEDSQTNIIPYDDFIISSQCQYHHNQYHDNQQYSEYHEQQTEDHQIERLLRKVSGSSYFKFRNGNSSKSNTMDTETRQKLKVELVKHINRLKQQYDFNANKQIEEQQIILNKYKSEAKQWENKYKVLKKYNKKIKLKIQQKKQKSTEGMIGGCKFWSWGLTQKSISNNKNNNNNINISKRKVARIAVSDDSDGY